jgi:two-component system sensor kinase FixL
MKITTPFNMIESNNNVTEVSLVNAFPDESVLPVLKIDTSGKILYANHASFECLREWINSKNEYLPNYFLNYHPHILNPDADFSMSINLKSIVLNFDVIGFKESGYIGLYGFDSVEEKEVNDVINEFEKSASLLN